MRFPQLFTRSREPRIRFWLSAGLIVLFASIWRFSALGQVPVGLTWDEVAIAYNGKMVWQTHRDEWLTLMPLSFKSFGDYKAPLAIYLNGIFTTVLGRDAWVVRLPFALSGVVAIAAMMWLSFELTQYLHQKHETKLDPETMALVSGFLLAVSPWHVHFSRVGFESGLSLTFVLLGVASGLYWRRTGTWLFGVSSVVLLSATLYTYHSSKIAVPLLALLLAWQWRHQITQRFIQSVSLVLLGIMSLAPLTYDMLFHSGAERLHQTSLLVLEVPWYQKVGLIVLNLVSHVLPGFLVFGQTPNLRHGDGVWGVLLPTTFIILVLMLILTLLNQLPTQYRRWMKWSLAWISIGLLPAAIGVEVPHANRALQALPGFIWITAVGLSYLSETLNNTKLSQKLRGSHGERQLLAKSVVGGWFLAHCLFFLTYWHHYTHVYKVASSHDFLDGYVAAFDRVFELQSQSSQVIFSDKYGQPYIFALWVGGIDPYQNHHFNYLHPFVFRGIEVTDLANPNTLVVATPDDYVPHYQADEVIYGVDHQPRFYFFLPQP